MKAEMLEHAFAVIMAGGGGTRLWPISRRSRPKQMLPLVEDRTLFQATVQRLDGLLPPERILVVTVEDQAQGLMDQAPEIPPDNFLLEPVPRGTASVVAFAAMVLKKRDPQSLMAILPSDHFIRNRDLFHLLLRVAFDVAQKGYLVTLGITPTYPATGYGYIQRGSRLPEQFYYPAYEVLRFKEKPDEAHARDLLASGDHSWNSGMFVWKTATILDEFARQMPALKNALDQIGAVLGTPEQESVMNRIWPGLKVETVDYGIMENAEHLAVLPASGLEWSDVGSWDSLFDVLLPDKDGNIVFSGEHIPHDTFKSLVYGNGGERLIVTIGVHDLIIVDSGDVLLVCHRDQAQKVRQIVDKIRETKREHYL